MTVESGSGQLLAIHSRLRIVVIARSAGGQNEHHSPRTGLLPMVLYFNEPSMVCVYPQFEQAALAPVMFQADALPDDRNLTESQARAINAAHELWASPDTGKREEAVFLWNSLSSSGIDVIENASLEASASGQISLNQLNGALAAAKRLSRQGNSEASIAGLWLDGWANIRLNNLDEGVSVLSEALAEAGEVEGLRPASAEVHILLGEGLVSLGRLDDGERHIREGLALAAGDTRLLALGHNNLGYVNLARSETVAENEEARRFLETSLIEHATARQLAKEAGDWAELAAIEINLGSVQERLGSLRQAIFHYHEALNLTERFPNPLTRLFLLANLGYVYQQVGDFSRSASYLTQALVLAERDSPGWVARLNCILGTTIRDQGLYRENPDPGQLEDALQRHRLCGELARLQDDLSLDLRARYEQAADLTSLGLNGQALAAISMAVQQVGSARRADLRLEIYNLNAQLLREQGDLNGAWDSIRLALSEAARVKSPPMRAVPYLEAIRILQARGDETTALEMGRTAMEVIERLHQDLDSERLGPAWSARSRGVFNELVHLHLQAYSRSQQQRDLREAYAILERSRAISLRQAIALNARAGVSKVTAGFEDLNQLSLLAGGLAADSTAEPAAMPLDYYNRYDLVARANGMRREVIPIPPSLGVADIQGRLKDNQAVITYLAGEQTMGLFFLSRNSVLYQPVSSTRWLRGEVWAAVGQLQTQGAGNGDRLSALSRLLLAPLGRFPQVTELIISPDDALHALPFAALPISAAGREEPLMMRYSVEITPSISAYFMAIDRQRANSNAHLVVVADPVFNESDLALDDTTGQEDSQGLRAFTGSLTRLPGTAREATNLQALFPDIRVNVYSGTEARRELFRDPDVLQATVLHIATHGFFDPANPENVGLMLSRLDSKGEYVAGFLTLPELFATRFANELVVVSGCDTARGKLFPGEGMMSMTRGFLAMGANQVISTLWPVSDSSSAKFMSLFYQDLRRHGMPSWALQHAQQQLRSSSRYHEPFHWAPYVLTAVSSERISSLTKESETQ